jgi:hypothetical protein
VSLDELGQVHAADLFLAFDEELDVAREFAIDGEKSVQRRQPAFQMAFVIAHSTGVHLAFANRRLEGRRVPQLEGLGRLDVVVIVEEQCPIAPASSLGKDGRRATGGHDPHRKLAACEHVGHELGALGHASVMSGDAWLGTEPTQLIQGGLHLSLDRFVYTAEIGHPILLVKRAGHYSPCQVVSSGLICEIARHGD